MTKIHESFNQFILLPNQKTKLGNEDNQMYS